MPFSYQSVVDLARIPLNDSDKARYTDADLLSYANQGMLQLVKRRPDLFMGSYSSLPDGEKALSDVFPLSAGYVQTLADYVTARAEMMDDEHANSGRASVYVKLFSDEAAL